MIVNDWIWLNSVSKYVLPKCHNVEFVVSPTWSINFIIIDQNSLIVILNFYSNVVSGSRDVDLNEPHCIVLSFMRRRGG